MAREKNPRSNFRLEIWPGIVTAVDEYEGGLQLQVDISHRVLRTETVYDEMKSLTRGGAADLKTEAEKALLGCVVLTRSENVFFFFNFFV